MLNSISDSSKSAAKVHVVIGQWEENNQTVLARVVTYCNSHKIDYADVRCRHITLGEFNDNGIEFYYNRQETTAEYNVRMEKIELDDLRHFQECIGNYNFYCREKPAVLALYEKHCVKGKYKGLFADWQKELLKQFFGEKTVAEQIADAYNKGKEDAMEALAALKTKIKDLTK